MNAYFISGLGADRRAFDKILLNESYTRYFLDWIEPLENETLNEYAERMAATIDQSKPFVLIGLSFGGIVAIEIAKRYPAEKIFIISSVSNRSELPWYLKAMGKARIHHLGTVEKLKQDPNILFWFFGVTSTRMKNYLTEMMHKTSSTYLRWSMDQIVNWSQEKKPVNLIHLHGDADKLFPIRFCKPDYMIAKGGHFMVITHARQINEILLKELERMGYHS
ncbi:MAG: alpha/beta hydrolase [Chitinophagaceae bacterium]|nr:alpha/beta hydrolase [Chitinophagaceae bacterium]